MVFIRPADAADAEAIASVRHQAWLTAYRGIVCDEYLDAMTVEESNGIIYAALVEKKENFFVAIDDSGTVIGFCAAGKERSGRFGCCGELYAIYLLKEFRRAGAGRRLVAAAAARLLKTGYADMMVWVLEKNPSAAFYEKLGAKKIGGVTVKIGEEEFMELAYVFNGLAALAEKD
jgi:GNAT superfamily N-acetyltransferase